MAENVVQDFNIDQLKEFFKTPKAAYEKLSLGGYVPWPQFYRLWHAARAPRQIGLFVTSAWSVWADTHLKNPTDDSWDLTPRQLSTIQGMVEGQ
jgi:hypothetical protein